MSRMNLGRIFLVGVPFVAIITVSHYLLGEGLNRFEFTQVEMAAQIKIVLYAADDATARKAAEDAFARFHKLNALFSDYDAQSELRRLCDVSSPGKPVAISDDLWAVLVAAQEISARSEGAFDVTVGPLTHFWRNVRRTKELPSPETIAANLESVGYRFLRLHPAEQKAELLRPKMRLDLGGIAKGYAVDQALMVLRRHGIPRAMIEAGGNIGLGDPPPGKSGWRIALPPLSPDRPPTSYLQLANKAVSTSGDLWQYVEIGGVRYSHIIDPHTGFPLTRRQNVTVVASDGLVADGLSSAIAVLGPERGLMLIKNIPGVEATITFLDENNKEKVYQSRGWVKLAN